MYVQVGIFLPKHKPVGHNLRAQQHLSPHHHHPTPPEFLRSDVSDGNNLRYPERNRQHFTRSDVDVYPELKRFDRLISSPPSPSVHIYTTNCAYSKQEKVRDEKKQDLVSIGS